MEIQNSRQKSQAILKEKATFSKLYYLFEQGLLSKKGFLKSIRLLNAENVWLHRGVRLLISIGITLALFGLSFISMGKQNIFLLTPKLIF